MSADEAKEAALAEAKRAHRKLFDNMAEVVRFEDGVRYGWDAGRKYEQEQAPERDTPYPCIDTRADEAQEEVVERVARAIWESYWPDRDPRWVREQWEANAVFNSDRVQRVPLILAEIAVSIAFYAGRQYEQAEAALSIYPCTDTRSAGEKENPS